MGTNFYARIIPTQKRKDEIKQAIDKNDFNKIQELVLNTYSKPHYTYNSNGNKYEGGEIHLGKRSGGWKFLWNTNWYKIIDGHVENEDKGNGVVSSHFVIDNPYKVFKYYDLTKKSIKQFIDREDIEIFNEYDEKQNKDDFWNMALSWGKEDGWDFETYYSKHKDMHYLDCSCDYTKFLEHYGFVMNKGKSDFYSDGLLFSTSTDFC